MKLLKVLQHIKYKADRKSLVNIPVELIAIDPDKVISGALYISLRNDKEREIKAIKNGCCAIICEGDIRGYNIPTIYVENIRKAYSTACFNISRFNNKSVKLIGVTGTNGKTSVSTIIYNALNSCGHRAGYIGTGCVEVPGKRFNSDFYSSTTPDPHILYPTLKNMQDDGCEYIVMEVSSHSLYYDKTYPLEFECSVFTNLTQDHMDFHKSMQDYYASKKKITNLSKCIVVNVDDKYGQLLAKESLCKVKTVGAVWDGDVLLRNINCNGLDGIEYMYYGNNFNFIARSKLCGVYNVYNTALALTSLIELGIQPYKAKKSLSEIQSITGRFEIINSSPKIIIDYAHTPDGMENVLKTIKSFSSKKKLHIIFGCGGERDKLKRPKMARIAEKYANSITVTSDNSRSERVDEIIGDIVKGFSEHTNYSIIIDRESAIINAIESACEDGVIAILGKGAENYMIDNNGYKKYSDKQTVLRALGSLCANGAKIEN